MPEVGGHRAETEPRETTAAEEGVTFQDTVRSSTPYDARDPIRPDARSTRLIALCLAAGAHVGIAAYLWQAQFIPHYRDIVADAPVQVHLLPPVRVTPPPPPPPIPTPETKPDPAKPRDPVRVQPRPPQATASARVAPLPVPPVSMRVEAVAPPVLAAPRPMPVLAPLVPAKPPEIRGATWLERPSGDEMARYYPERAARRGVEGRAALACSVTAEGRLTDCRVAAEDPAGERFGQAALKMSRHFKMRPMTRDGTPVAGGRIEIPIRFTLPA